MSKADPQQHPRPTALNRIGRTLRALFRTRVTAGLLVVLPIYVTWLLLSFVFRLLRDSSLWVVDAYLRSPLGDRILAGLEAERLNEQGKLVDMPLVQLIDLREAALGRPLTTDEFVALLPPSLQWGVAIFCVLLTILILYSVGLFTANIVGRRVIHSFETLVDKVPLVKTVYRASKQILETFSGEQTENFQRVALIPFPQERMRCVGFITSTFIDSETQEELATVFIPTTPNPTTGYLQILKRKELTELNWTIEEAIRCIMSGGILRPQYLTILPTEEVRKLHHGLPEGMASPKEPLEGTVTEEQEQLTDEAARDLPSREKRS